MMAKKKLPETAADRRRVTTVTRPSPLGGGEEKQTLCVDDPLEHLAVRRLITTAQKQAGDRYRAAFEATSGLRGLGVDLTREKVDTSGIGQSISPRVADGMTDIKTAIRVLGKQDYAIMLAVAGQGTTITDYSRRVGDGGEYARKYIGQRFRDALTALALEWGYERPGRTRHRPHVLHQAGTINAPATDSSAWVHPQNRPRD